MFTHHCLRLQLGAGAPGQVRPFHRGRPSGGRRLLPFLCRLPPGPGGPGSGSLPIRHPAKGHGTAFGRQDRPPLALSSHLSAPGASPGAAALSGRPAGVAASDFVGLPRALSPSGWPWPFRELSSTSTMARTVFFPLFWWAPGCFSWKNPPLPPDSSWGL